MPDEMLLGFDARTFPAPPWDDRRRRAYLLRHDVGRPLSVDPGAWPSVFASGTDADDGIAVPAWVGPTAALWERLDRMRACLAVADVDLTSARLPD